MISVLIDETLKVQDYTSLFVNISQQVFTYLEFHEEVDLSINLMNDAAIQALNRQYRQLDRPTDVLSFESDEMDPETGIRYLGDIAISYNRAHAQAEEAGHPVENELQLLIIHGILHLVGFDHDSLEAKKTMWTKQAQILDHLKIKLNKISGDEPDA